MPKFGWVRIGTIATALGLVIGVLGFLIPAAEDQREEVYLVWSAQSDWHNSCRDVRNDLLVADDELELKQAQIAELLALRSAANPNGLSEWHLGLMRSYHDLTESRRVFEQLRAGFVEARTIIEDQFQVDFSERDQPLTEWQYNIAYPILVDALAEHGFTSGSSRDVRERIRRWTWGRDNVPTISPWYFANPNVNGQTFNRYVPLLDRAIEATRERESEISVYEEFWAIRDYRDLEGEISSYQAELEQALETEAELNERLETERVRRRQLQNSVARAQHELNGLRCGELLDSCSPPGSALRPSMLSAMLWTLRDWVGQDVNPRPVCSTSSS